MFIIWRGMGWLILPFFLLTWWIAEGLILPAYRGNTGFEYVYNAEKGVMWGVAFLLTAVLVLLFVLFVQRPLERVPSTDEEWARWEAKQREGIAAMEKVKADAGVASDPHAQAQLRGEAPIPRPVKKSSSFFFIPLWVFPILFAALGVLLIVLNVGTAIDEVAVREGL